MLPKSSLSLSWYSFEPVGVKKWKMKYISSGFTTRHWYLYIYTIDMLWRLPVDYIITIIKTTDMRYPNLWCAWLRLSRPPWGSSIVPTPSPRTRWFPASPSAQSCTFEDEPKRWNWKSINSYHFTLQSGPPRGVSPRKQSVIWKQHNLWFTSGLSWIRMAVWRFGRSIECVLAVPHSMRLPEHRRFRCRKCARSPIARSSFFSFPSRPPWYNRVCK